MDDITEVCGWMVSMRVDDITDVCGSMVSMRCVGVWCQ